MLNILELRERLQLDEESGSIKLQNQIASSQINSSLDISKILENSLRNHLAGDQKLVHKQNFSWKIEQPVYKIHNHSHLIKEWYKIGELEVESTVTFENEPVMLICNEIDNCVESFKFCKILYIARIIWERQCLSRSTNEQYSGRQVWVPIIQHDGSVIEFRILYSINPERIDFCLSTILCLKIDEQPKIELVLRNLYSMLAKEMVPYVNIESFEFPEANFSPADLPVSPISSVFRQSICAELKKTGEFEEPFNFLLQADHCEFCSFVLIQTKSLKYNRIVTIKVCSTVGDCFDYEKRVFHICKDLGLRIPMLLETKELVKDELSCFIFDFYDKFVDMQMDWNNLLTNTECLIETIHGFKEKGFQHGNISTHNLGLMKDKIILTNYCKLRNQNSYDDLKALKSLLKDMDQRLPLNQSQSSRFYSLLASSF